MSYAKTFAKPCKHFGRIGHGLKIHSGYMSNKTVAKLF